MIGIMGPMVGMEPMMMDPSQMSLIILPFILGISYLVLWIWQIFNARELAKKFNESVQATGKEPW
jgi:hypothetical protein